MSIARLCFPRFSSLFSGIGILALLVGCSSPKTAAVPAAKPGPAIIETAEHPNPANADPGVPSDAFVAAVRAGTMSGYPQATIGHAFETAFADAHWSSQQPESGARIVTFTGLLPANMRRDCVSAKAGPPASPCVQDAKVTFEWTFASDGHLFHLSHVDPEPWPETHRSTREMLLYIFG
jgi:hypothetical protein